MSKSPAPASRFRVDVDVALLAILALGLLFRLYRIDVPLVDGHSWRQVTNADIARHFAQSTWNLFTPQVSWGGRNGVLGMEFPLLHYLIGLSWRVTGESETIARLIPVAFSVTSVGLLYTLGRELFSPAIGRGAAFLLAIAPSSVFFGRSVLSDAPMVTFTIAAVLAWHRQLTSPSRRRLVVATACTALAGLVKLPGVIVGVPIAVLVWQHRGRHMFRDRAIWIGGVTSVLLIAGWYGYADLVASRTGLTQAIFRPSGVYGPEIGLAPAAYETVSHWSTADELGDAAFYRDMLDRFWGLHLTPVGFAGALLGWWLARGLRHSPVIDGWLAAGLIFVLATITGQRDHQFHQLPLIPPLALFFGVTVAPIFAHRGRMGAVRSIGVAACLTLFAVTAFRASNVLTHLYREENMQEQFPAIGNEIRSITQEDALIVSVDYRSGGTNSPMLLYYAHRQGWSFDVRAITPAVVGHLRDRFGARYFVTLQWSSLGEYKPELIYYLEQFEQIRLDTGNSQVRMFDLRQLE